MGNHAEPMKGVGFVGPGNENPVEQLCCLVKQAALEQHQRSVIRHGNLRTDAVAAGATTAPSRHRHHGKKLLKPSLLESVLLMSWASVKASRLSVPPPL